MDGHAFAFLRTGELGSILLPSFYELDGKSSRKNLPSFFV